MEIIILQFKNAVMLGCQYSLIAIGFTLFFGALNICVFCHVDFTVVALFGATGLIHLVLSLGITILWLKVLFIIIAIVIAIAVTGLVGVAVQRVAIKPLMGSPVLLFLLITAAMGIVMAQLMKLIVPQGANPYTFPMDFWTYKFQLGSISFALAEIIVVITTICMFALIYYLLRKTRMGAEIQAISQDYEAASMVGINVDRGIIITFFFGAMLAAVAGLMNGIYYSVFKYNMGTMAGIKGFSASVVGGLGSVFGAIIGGFLMAFVEVFATAFIPGATPYKDIFSFVVVLIFLIFKPEGILGERISEKV